MRDFEHYEADWTTFGAANANGEYPEEFEHAEATGSEGTLPEMDEMEFATELLDARDDAALDQLLVRLLKRVGQRGQRQGKPGHWLQLLHNSPLAHHLKTHLKACVRQTQATALRDAGEPPAPAITTATAADDSPTPEEILGLELEGLSPEDREFAIARQLIRLAGAASDQAISAPATPDPVANARSAVASAAHRFAPGLLRQRPRPHGACRCSSRQNGRWIRRGNNVVLLL